MNTERRHRVSYSMREVVEALKAHRPDCLHTQAIPVERTPSSTPGVPPGSPATMASDGVTVDFIWHRNGRLDITA
jgi:hypothetical protein